MSKSAVKVIEIKSLGKKRYRVFFDEKEPVSLYAKELSEFQIKEAGEISLETYERIVNEILKKRVKLRALNLLSKKRYSKKQLENKLYEGGYSETLTDEAINYVKSYGYIDDYELAKDYVTSHIDKYSVNELKNKLYQKGIDIQISENVIEELVEIGEIDPEESQKEQILKELKKLKAHEHILDEKELGRLYSFCSRKGYSFAKAREHLTFIYKECKLD